DQNSNCAALCQSACVALCGLAGLISFSKNYAHRRVLTLESTSLRRPGWIFGVGLVVCLEHSLVYCKLQRFLNHRISREQLFAEELHREEIVLPLVLDDPFDQTRQSRG